MYSKRHEESWVSDRIDLSIAEAEERWARWPGLVNEAIENSIWVAALIFPNTYINEMLSQDKILEILTDKQLNKLFVLFKTTNNITNMRPMNATCLTFDQFNWNLLAESHPKDYLIAGLELLVTSHELHQEIEKCRFKIFLFFLSTWQIYHLYWHRNTQQISVSISFRREQWHNGKYIVYY